MTDRYRARNISELHIIIEKRIEGETDQQLEDRLHAVHGYFSDQAIHSELEAFFREHPSEYPVDSIISRADERNGLLRRSCPISRNSEPLLTERAKLLADKLEDLAHADEEQ